MAAKSAIGIMRNSVMERFAALPGFVMPTQGRDPDLLHVQQLEAVLTWIECNMPNTVPLMGVVDVPMVQVIPIEQQQEGVLNFANTNGAGTAVAQPAPRGKGKRK